MTLLMASTVVATAVAGISYFDIRFDGLEDDQIASPPVVQGNRRIENPRYVTQQPDGRPVFVSADWALPDRENADRIRLENVIAKSEGDSGTKFLVTASRGIFFPAKGSLILIENVRLLGRIGESFESQSMFINVQTNTVRSPGPVKYQTGTERLTAGELLIEDDGDGRHSTFAGGVRAVYLPVGEADDS